MSQLQYRNENQNFISNFVFQFIKKAKWHTDLGTRIFTYNSRMLIILFSTGLYIYKSAFSSYFFSKTRFLSFCVLVSLVPIPLVFYFLFFSVLCFEFNFISKYLIYMPHFEIIAPLWNNILPHFEITFAPLWNKHWPTLK